MRERNIEKRLRQKVEKLGGLCFKFVSPGHRGVPDRIVVWPDGIVHFIELKASWGKLSAVQRYVHAQLRQRGCGVFVLSTYARVDEYIEWRRECENDTVLMEGA